MIQRMSESGRSQDNSGRIAFLLAQVGGLAASWFADRIAPRALAPAHAGLLRSIAAEPGLSQQAVSHKLGLVPSRLVTLVDELEVDGSVERRRNPRDRRQYGLYLTSVGEQRVAEIGALAQQHGNELLAPLSDADRATLGRLLAQLASAHGLTPGVHPDYRQLGRDQRPSQPHSQTSVEAVEE
jgi:DNA-binding MarR family transcriptional regulator